MATRRFSGRGHVGRRPSIQTRAKISKALKGRKRPGKPKPI